MDEVWRKFHDPPKYEPDSGVSAAGNVGADSARQHRWQPKCEVAFAMEEVHLVIEPIDIEAPNYFRF